MTNDFAILRLEVNYFLSMLYETFGKYYRDTAKESLRNIFDCFYFNKNNVNLINNIELINNYIDSFSKFDENTYRVTKNNIPTILNMIKILNMEYSAK